MESRKIIMEKLNEQEEVENVLKCYVDKFETFIDINNVIWNSVDIFLTTKKESKLWKENGFRKQILSKSYLWETYQSVEGENSREDVIKRKKENYKEQLRSRGYLV